MKIFLIILFITTLFVACQKLADSDTVFEGYVKNKITNKPLANSSIMLETEGGGGSWIYNPKNNSLKNGFNKSSSINTTQNLNSSKSSTPIADISTNTDANGYFRVKSTSKVRYLEGSYFENDIMADFRLNDFKQNEINKVNILVDCPAYLWPILAGRGNTEWTDSVAFWIIGNSRVVMESMYDIYFNGQSIAGAPIRAQSSCNPYADRFIKYKIGFKHKNDWIYTIDSIYLKSFTIYTDTLYYNIR